MNATPATWVMMWPIAGVLPVTSTSSTISARWVAICGCGALAAGATEAQCLTCAAQAARRREVTP